MGGNGHQAIAVGHRELDGVGPRQRKGVRRRLAIDQRPAVAKVPGVADDDPDPLAGVPEPLNDTGAPAVPPVGGVNDADGALSPTVTSAEVPMLVPSLPNTVSATVYCPAEEKVWESVAPVVSSGLLPSLNCQLYRLTPPGAVDPAPSKLTLSPRPGVEVNWAVGRRPAKDRRCRHPLPWLLHSCWYQ